MIHLICTNCQSTLEIDDAFAGGVCRCQHCGTIQTVPAHMKGNASAAPNAIATPKPQQQKSLYQNQRRPQEQQTGRGGGTGLDELSEAVASSSGLARGGLRNKKPGLLDGASVTTGLDYATPPQKKKIPVLWIVIAAVAAGLVLIGLIGFASVAPSTAVVSTPAPVGGRGTPTVGTSPVITSDDGDADAPTAPHFCDLDLTPATGVVYVLDRGSASGELLDTLKGATYASLETLGPRRKFAIVFWQAGSEPAAAFPEKGMIDASPSNIDDATKALEDIVAQGRSDPATALENAAARQPSDVIFVTAKGDQLGDDVVAQVGTALAGKRVHAIAVGEDFGTALKAIAKQQNGTYQLLDRRQLETFSRGK